MPWRTKRWSMLRRVRTWASTRVTVTFPPCEACRRASLSTPYRFCRTRRHERATPGGNKRSPTAPSTSSSADSAWTSCAITAERRRGRSLGAECGPFVVRERSDHADHLVISHTGGQHPKVIFGAAEGVLDGDETAHVVPHRVLGGHTDTTMHLDRLLADEPSRTPDLQ